MSQIHNLYASQANWAFDDDQASTVDVDATSRVRFLFESQNSLRAALRDAIDEDIGEKTIYDEDGTEMLTYRSDGAPEGEGDEKQTLENIDEEEKQDSSSEEEDESSDDDDDENEHEQGSSNT